MRCDDAKRRILGGEPLEGELRDHLAVCPECGEEFAFIATLRDAAPVPEAALRSRVLAAQPRVFRWRVALVAASIALAAGLGFAGGRAVEPPARIVVQTVERRAPVDERQVTVMAVALMSTYKGQVECEFDGTRCRKIRADRAVLRMLPYCPIIQELDAVEKSRPELISYR
jgi:hypothetical protein